jgi:hypothetical protein
MTDRMDWYRLGAIFGIVFNAVFGAVFNAVFGAVFNAVYSAIFGWIGFVLDGILLIHYKLQNIIYTLFQFI